MSKARPYLFSDSQAGVQHVMSRIIEKRYLLGVEEKEFFVKTMRAYEDVLGVEVLAYCVMSNHFHMLVRVPHRPEGLEVPLEVVLARLERAVGEEAMALIRRQISLWERAGLDSAIEEWRLQQVARMFSLSEFVKCVKMRFSRWYNKRTGRSGPLWESRFTSVMVEEEERALRTMAAYIDLNPVRAGMVSDPADYRWSSYAEAMAGKARARRGLVRIIGQSAWPRESAAGAAPWGEEPFTAVVERRALVIYRAILGGQGAGRKQEDGRVVRRGVSEKVRQRLTTPKERQLRAEVLQHRVRHFTQGVVFGSRAFINSWFEANRSFVKGRSQRSRTTGARSLGRAALRGLYSLRDPQ